MVERRFVLLLRGWVRRCVEGLSWRDGWWKVLLGGFWAGGSLWGQS
jgi:hypothetical protein